MRWFRRPEPADLVWGVVLFAIGFAFETLRLAYLA